MGMASYVLYRDKCATSIKCYATNLVDTTMKSKYCGGSNMEKIVPTRPTPFNVLLLKMFLFA
jgi:hypothetical protein